jgi:hypothetical protein
MKNNVGFKSYVATIEVLQINGDVKMDARSSGHSLLIQLKGGDLNSYISNCLQFMSQNMEQAVLSA